MRLVVDANVSITWAVEDEENPYAERALAAIGEDNPLAPRLWRWEVANTLLVLERRKRLPDAASTYASVVKRFAFEFADDAHEREELILARKHDLSVYDASYLALAKRLQFPLVTLDVKLAKAAVAEGMFFAGDTTA